MNLRFYSFVFLGYQVLLLFTSHPIAAQGRIKWTQADNRYYRIEGGEIVQYTLPQNTRSIFISKQHLTNAEGKFLAVENFSFSADYKQVLLFTNTRKVWRLNTRGDYWIFDTSTRSLKQLGVGRPSSSLMFAKLSPDGRKAAYVSEYNLYVEDLSSGRITPLTKDGNRKLPHGTFDWAYEEEFFCRDGFRWSPNSSQIAFWQMDARQVKDYLMVNNTDSIYPMVTPVE